MLVLTQPGPQGAFTPLSITGVQLWLKADALLLADGAAVASWTDSSGLGNHAVQATGTKKPTYKTNIKNGWPVARFDGGDGLQVPSITIGPYTVFAVFSASVNGIIYEHGPNAGTTAGSFLYTTTNYTVQVRRGAVLSDKDRAASWGIGSTWRVVTTSFDGTHAGHVFSINGVLQSMTNGADTSNPGTGTVAAALNVGARNNAAAVFLTGDIAELLIYNSALNATDRAAVEAYLNAKYAVF